LNYDAENRLISVTNGQTTVASFIYDGDGNRVQSIIGGTTTTFVGNYYENTAGVATKYYYAGTQRVAMRKNGTLYFMLSDQLGSTSVTTDSNGQNPVTLEYYAWGGIRYSSGTTPTNYTYTGQYSNMSDFGLMYYNARWYDPYLNQFTQPDTIVPDGPQGYDRYEYAEDNPIRYNDPTGHRIACDDGYLGSCNDLGYGDDPSEPAKQQPQPWTYTKNIRVGFHVGASVTNAPDQSSDDFLKDEESEICSDPEAAAICAIAASERFALAGPSNINPNFFEDFTVTYDESKGITISGMNLVNSTGDTVEVTGITLMGGGGTVYYPSASIKPYVFGEEAFNVPNPPTFNSNSPLSISVGYKQVINTGSAAFPGPSILYRSLVTILPSLPTLQYLMQTGQLPPSPLP